MEKLFNPLDDSDRKTLDASGNVVIITRSARKNLPMSDYYYGNNSVVHHQRIELPEHQHEPGPIHIGSDERYLTLPIIEGHYKCKPCGTNSMRPISGGSNNLSIIECECDYCRMKMFIEIPYRKNTQF
jgi:hypothetical protein